MCRVKTSQVSWPLAAKCEGCGASGALYQPHLEFYYCPRCATRQDECNQARRHLGALLKPVVEAWRTHWLERGLTAAQILDLVQNNDKVEDIVMCLDTDSGSA